MKNENNYYENRIMDVLWFQTAFRSFENVRKNWNRLTVE